MLFRPTHLLAVLLVASVAVAGTVAATGTGGLDDIAESLPPQLDWRTAPALEPAAIASPVTARTYRVSNSMLVERDVERAVRAMVLGRSGGVSKRLAGAAIAGPRRTAIGRAFAGIPAAELSLSARSERPRTPTDPWTFRVAVDVRDVAGTESPFNKPAATVELVASPGTDPTTGVVQRWNVRQLRLERGGLLLVDRAVTYQRRGPIAIAAPATSRALAATAMQELTAMLPALERDYRGLRTDGRGVFVVLVSRRPGADRALAQVGPDTFTGEVAGIATNGSMIALDLRTLVPMQGFERRALLRHELAHVVTEEFARRAPDAYSEGLAQWEGDHEITKTGRYYMLNGSAVDAMQEGALELDDFLFSDRSFDSRRGLGRAAQYRMGSIVVDYLHRTHGRAKALRMYRMLSEGAAPRRAVKAALGVSPEAFRAGVEQWARTHRTWDG